MICIIVINLRLSKSFHIQDIQVYQKDKNNIIGVIYTKDILCALDTKLAKQDLRPILKYHIMIA